MSESNLFSLRDRVALATGSSKGLGKAMVVAGLLAFNAVKIDLRAATPPPEVHMLIPGFTVEELPVRLPNLNNVNFAPDGSLTGLGYNGKVWKIRDTDGDGLEDTATIWWDKAPLTVPVGMVWSTHGLFVSSSGKVSLLKDTDGNDVADNEEVVASGWPDKDVTSGNVDATGVTMDSEGNLYFGLLTVNYANPYRLKKVKDLAADDRAWLVKRDRAIPNDPEEEVSLYDIDSQRGTAQKWNAKTHQLETLGTGVRVPYCFAFNKAGDLFFTDQEGETWCPNGNPLDELNVVVRGHNYGFPPRHEKWLPGLVSDEPVVAFGPQHESSCGFVFNEPHGRVGQTPGLSFANVRERAVALPAAPAQGLFGPNWWEGDAIVAGESRGKIWRVKLTKTDNGYTGKQFLIARLSMLTMDVAISPKGDLYVSCHSGLPDWGTGPNGEGKIFRIRYTDPEAPQPVYTWASSPSEVRVAFDRDLPKAITRAKAAIEFGVNVRAADELEIIKPSYEAVHRQEAQPRSRLPVTEITLAGDPSVLVIKTAPMVLAESYALKLTSSEVFGRANSLASVYMGFDLSGVLVTSATDDHKLKLPGGEKVDLPVRGEWVWKSGLTEKGFHTNQPVVLLALDSTVASDLSKGSHYLTSMHKRVFATSDHEVSFQGWYVADPARPFMEVFSEDRLFITGTDSTNSIGYKLKGSWMVVTGSTNSVGILDFKVSRQWSSGPISTAVSSTPGQDLRPLPLGSFLLPWASTPSKADELAVATMRPRGDFETGRSVFFGEQLKCSTCHRIRGEGAGHGPDLSNLASRDAASVLRDIRQPSATINPDYVGYNVRMRNNDEFTGFVRNEGNDRLKITTVTGVDTIVIPTDVAEMRPGGVSLMPEGLIDNLKESQVNDLLTFLLNDPPKRDKAEVRKLIGMAIPGPAGHASAESPGRRPALRVVLVASKQDHGKDQHDYPAWQKAWHPLLARVPGVTVEDAWLWPTSEQFSNADAILFYFWNHEWDDAKYAQLDAFQARGGGLIILHSATIEDKEPRKLALRIGLAAQPDTVKYRHMPFELKITDSRHAITRGLPGQIQFIDEPYWPMIGDLSKIHILASAVDIDSEDRPMMWTFEKGRGRVFASIASHYTWTWSDPLFQTIVLRGLDWVTRADEFGGVALK